jgi:putative addiction module component (TIGR02574 family)
MASSLKDIEQQARALAPEDRARLAESLLASLHGPALAAFDDAWREEVEQRLAAHDRGDTPTYAAEDVFTEARRRPR